MPYSIGVDYGTSSVRAMLVDASNGAELATAVYEYPSGVEGVLIDPSDPNIARQHPGDYIDGFYHAVADVVHKAAGIKGFCVEDVVGIGIDTTGSTPIPVNKQGIALGTLEEFKLNLNAQAWLWKDHSSYTEAEKITRAAANANLPYLAKCGGVYSSEWYWSKILHCMHIDRKVAEATYSWVELADYVPAYVTGNSDPNRMSRSICAAGHKAMYHTDWGGLPSASFLDSIERGLSRFRYVTTAVPSDRLAGRLTESIAERVGLVAGIPVAVGAFDAHMGAVGAGCREGTLVKIIGTSTCDCMLAPMTKALPDIPGLCGIVPESIVPGMYGLEAGQSAVGDIFNWFIKQLCPGEYESDDEAHKALSSAAAKLLPGESGLIALDWNNGNRTILVDPLLTGLLIGQTLHTTAAEIYRTLIEATALGALTIINRIEEYGVKVEQVINCGGIAEKSPLVMQIYADVCNRPMRISRSGQTCALGAAIFGAVVGEVYPSVEAAQQEMTGIKEVEYTPIPENVAIYEQLHNIYRTLHDAFGLAENTQALSGVMKNLLNIRSSVRSGKSS